MPAIYLIRHGQASYGEDEYDALSLVGVRQSARLGAWWADRGEAFDAVYVGPRRRQIDTARHMIDAGRGAGADWPEPTQVEELDELPAFELLRHWLPILQAESAELRDLIATAAASGNRTAALDVGFHFIVDRWSRGELDVPHLESFAGFRARVERGLAQVAAGHPVAPNADGRRPRVAVVTSGGPISIAMRLALGLGDEDTLRVMGVVRNGSFSEFRGGPAAPAAASPARRTLTMIAFNAVPHLVDKDLVTYR